MKISYSEMVNCQSEVVTAHSEAEAFESWLATTTDLKILAVKTGEGGTIWHNEIDWPSEPGYDNLGERPWAETVEEKRVALLGMREGRRTFYEIGDYLELAPVQEIADEHLKGLRNTAKRKTTQWEKLEKQIASGDVVISPTLEEERITAMAESSRKEQQTLHIQGLVARTALAHYKENYEKYRERGHDMTYIDTIMRDCHERMAIANIQEV